MAEWKPCPVCGKRPELVVVPCLIEELEFVEELEETERGENGFGSTGR